MKIFLLKDIINVGMAGDVVKVAEGYGRNYVLPRKLGTEITPENEGLYSKKIEAVERKKEVVASQTSMLAERIKTVHITLKRKLHDDGKLYGSVNPLEIVELLAEKGIKISKNQVEMHKAIKEKGTFEVTIKLSSRLKPALTLKVVSDSI
jgi:large subunit ribosomal protein L9